MKIFNKYTFSAAMVGLISLSLTSCSDKDDYSPGSPADGPQVYFPAGMQSQYQLSQDGSSFNITIYRVDDSSDATIPVTVVPSQVNVLSDAFTFPSSVSFEAGETTATYTVQYDIDDFKDEDGEFITDYYDSYQQFNLELDDASTTPYGVSSIEISAYLPGPWTSLGMGTYTDNYNGCNDSEDDDEMLTSNVEFQISDLDPYLFRVNNPYTWIPEDANEYFQFRLLPPGSSFEESWGTYEIPEDLGRTIVYYPTFRIDDWGGYGLMYIYFPWNFKGYDTADFWKYNYVVDWQAPKTVNGTTMTLPGEIHLSPMYLTTESYGKLGWEDQDIVIIFPGYTKLNTNVEVTYNGLLHKPDETLEAEAYITLGKNVTEAKVALVPGSSPTSEQISQIQDGTIESISIKTSGQVNIPFDTENAAGKYSIVALSYYNDEYRQYDYATFQYSPATGETWSYVTTGIYTYLDGMFDEEGVDVQEILDLYESDSNPGSFKLENWMDEDYPLLFTVDSDGNITVPEQETGIVTSAGMVYIEDMNLYTGTNNWPSYLEDGVYNFCIIYYVSGGYYGYGYEYFEPMTVGASTKAATRASVSNADKFLQIKGNLKAKRAPREMRLRKMAKNLETGLRINR